MTWSDVISTGRGRIAYRLMVEGWPYEFVTDRAITHATNADGRTVLPGLLYGGLAIGERIIMQEAAIEADSITFRIRPTDSRELTVTALSTYPDPSAQITQDLSTLEQDFIAFTGPVAINEGDVLHVGTETIRKHSAGGHSYQRHIWDTQPQSHNIEIANGTQLAVYAYTFPPAMEGRHAYLFAYGTGDDVAGDGTCIWRGIVATPPTIDVDGLTWMIATHPITKVLAQQLAGSIQEAHPAYIQHTMGCCVYVSVTKYDSSTPTAVTGYAGDRYFGLDTEESLVAIVNTGLESARSGASLSCVDFIKIEVAAAGWQIHIKTNGSTQDAFDIVIASPIIGVFKKGETELSFLASDKSLTRPAGIAHLETNTEYYGVLSYKSALFRGSPEFSYTSPPVCPLGQGCMVMASPDWVTACRALPANQIPADNPRPDHWFPGGIDQERLSRIFLDTDMTGVEAVHISDTFWPTGMFEVMATGTYNGIPYIDVRLPQLPSRNIDPSIPNNHYTMLVLGFFGFLTANTKITALRKYANAARLGQFVEGLKVIGAFANDGDTPFITDADFDSWLTNVDGTDPIQIFRNYWFAKPKALEDVLKAELLFQNCYMRLGATGKMQIQPLPSFTDVEIVDAAHTIDVTGIVTPGSPGGAWPGWLPQRDGLVTVVEIKQGYDPLDDSWKGKPTVVLDASAVSIHKTRGKVAATIAPYSTEPPSATADSTLQLFERIGGRFLEAFAREYVVLTVKVPFKHFSVLCGDVVSITHRLIPAGDGTRGVTGRRGICIARRWPLDPAVQQAGELDIYIPRAPEVGYTPSAIITAQTNPSGNVWNLTCSAANSINVALSTNGNGRVLEHFWVGDYIRVIQRDTITPTIVTGIITVSSPDAGTATVALDGTWTPGSLSWVLEYQQDTNTGSKSTPHQRKFCYVADANLARPDGRIAGLLG